MVTEDPYRSIVKESYRYLSERFSGGVAAGLRSLPVQSIATPVQIRYQDLAKAKGSPWRRNVSEGLSPKSFL